MSLFGMYQNHVLPGRLITRALAQQDLSGNLCRCTGYRPILDAAQTMADLPRVTVNEVDLLQQLKQLNQAGQGLEANLAYFLPDTQAELLRLRNSHPAAQLVAGCTDVGLWVNKGHRRLPQVLDLSRVAELRRVEIYPHHLAIGAAVPLTEAFAALVADRPQLQAFAQRFAGLPVRNSGTLGGNVANGSPIGDSMPLLIALGANLGDPIGQLRRAFDQLDALAAEPVRRSSLWETSPVDCPPGSPTFTKSSAFSTLSSESSEMWSSPSRPSSRPTNTPKFVIFVIVPFTTSPALYRDGMSPVHGSSAICLSPRAIRRRCWSTESTLHSISWPFSTISLGCVTLRVHDMSVTWSKPSMPSSISMKAP
jgi:hypothetical protein